jgi:hypothetical protein
MFLGVGNGRVGLRIRRFFTDVVALSMNKPLTFGTSWLTCGTVQFR